MDLAVQQYIEAIPATHRPLFDRLQALILDLYPTAEIVISYKIPTFKVGRKRVYLGLWKEGVSLHAVSVDDFKQKHPTIKTGRGSLNFKITDEVPGEDVQVVIKQAIGEN